MNGGGRGRAAPRAALEPRVAAGWPRALQTQRWASFLTVWVLVEWPTGICRRLSGGSQAHRQSPESLA